MDGWTVEVGFRWNIRFVQRCSWDFESRQLSACLSQAGDGYDSGMTEWRCVGPDSRQICKNRIQLAKLAKGCDME